MAGVGTELKKMIPAWMAKPTPSCGCNDYAKKMDKWGPDGCESRRSQIISKLVSNKHLLPAGLQKVPRPMMRAAADKMLTAAIRKARIKY